MHSFMYTYTERAHFVVFRTIVVGNRHKIIANMSLLVITVWVGFFVWHERCDVEDDLNRNKKHMC